MLCARRWSDAGPAGRGKVLASTVQCTVYIAESSKQGSKRFNCITQTIHFAYLGILLIYWLHNANSDVNLAETTNLVFPIDI